MAYFRSGIKIISEISKTQGRGLLNSRSFSEDRTSTATYHYQIRNKSTETKNSSPPLPEITQNETKKSSSWFSFWSKKEAKTEEECKPLNQEPVSDENSLVYAMPVKALPGRNVYISTLPGPIEKMLEQQKKHLHPSQVNNTKYNTYSTDTDDVSNTVCDNPLTEQQKLFIQRLQTSSSTAYDELKTVETDKDTPYRNVTIEKQTEPMDATVPYYSLKKTLNSSIFFSDAKENPTLSLKRSYSTLPLNSLENHAIITNQSQPQDSSIRFYSSKKKKSRSKSGKKSGKKGKKQECKKISSGLSAGKATKGCPSFKLGDCPPRARPDCKPEKLKMKPCTKLDAPFPSYSECAKDPPPKHHPTECPTDDKGPLPECIKENRGISIDGCNPPAPAKPKCPKPKNRAARPRANKLCDEKVKKCDPSLKPYKNAGSSSSSPIKCLSSTTLTGRISEPNLVNKLNQVLSEVRFYSDCKKKKSGKKSRSKSKKKSKSKCGKKSRSKSGKKSRSKSRKKSKSKCGKKRRSKSGKKSRSKSGKKSKSKCGKKSRNKSGKKSRSKSGKKGKKQECKKVSSGLSAGKATKACPSFKLSDCPPRARPDCEPEKLKMKPCTKLDAPFPSYSECAKDPPPKHHPTECYTDDKGPLPQCIKENRGISIDGCNPPAPKKPKCPKPKNRAPPPSANKLCDEKVEKCDPSLKPYKNAGSSTSSPMKCVSSIRALTGRVSEPTSISKLSQSVIRFLSDSKNTTTGKKGKKQECKKVSSGLSAGKATKGCPSFKLGDCPPRARPDCEPEKIKMKPCTKLDAPFPSYSECTKSPPPKHHPTECPTDDKGPLPECIKENRGLSLNGCNPPAPAKLKCPKPKNRAAPPRANKLCDEKVEKCDPSLKPHKNAGSSSSPTMKCTSATMITERVSEPSLSASRHFLPRRSFSSSCKETRKPCFKNVGKAVKKEKIVLDSPVSCTFKKGKKGGKCDHGTCQPATSFRPWKVCPKPTRTVNHFRCPKKVVVKRQKIIIKKPHRCQQTMKVVKQCPKPSKSRKPNFQCTPKKKSSKIVVRPPTPKRCACASSNAALSPQAVLAAKRKKCNKLKNAVEPDCKRGGEKRDTKCPRRKSKGRKSY